MNVWTEQVNVTFRHINLDIVNLPEEFEPATDGKPVFGLSRRYNLCVNLQSQRNYWWRISLWD